MSRDTTLDAERRASPPGDFETAIAANAGRRSRLHPSLQPAFAGDPTGQDNCRRLARLHQLDAIFTIFGASDRGKRLILQGRGLRKRL